MLILCYSYCIPLARFLFFAASPIVFIMAMFMLKRAVYSERRVLKSSALGLMFVTVFKMLMIDLRLEKDYVFCKFLAGLNASLPLLTCGSNGVLTSNSAKVADFIGIILFVLASFGLLQVYRSCMAMKERPLLSPDQVNLRFWANVSLWCVLAMLCRLAAPWVGYLTVGSVPAFFTVVPWQVFAFVNLALLINGFWKSESCAWDYDVMQKEKMRHLTHTWTARDTLWLNTFLYIIVVGLSYVSGDVLSMHGTISTAP